jgi:hypothetical protein
MGRPAVVFGHPQDEPEAVAAVLGEIAQVVVEAGVLTWARFQQLDGLVDRAGVEVPVWGGADVVEPQLHTLSVSALVALIGLDLQVTTVDWGLARRK